MFHIKRIVRDIKDYFDYMTTQIPNSCHRPIERIS